MATATLTFANPINSSAQVGDIVFKSTTTTSGNFTSSSQSDVVFLGACLTISADRLTMTVDYDATITSPPQARTDYVFFSKDKYSNPSGLLGYYAKVCFRNNSKTEAELFAISTDIFESSK